MVVEELSPGDIDKGEVGKRVQFLSRRESLSLP